MGGALWNLGKRNIENRTSDKIVLGEFGEGLAGEKDMSRD